MRKTRGFGRKRPNRIAVRSGGSASSPGIAAPSGNSFVGKFDLSKANGLVGMPLQLANSKSATIDWGDGAGPQTYTTSGLKTRDVSALGPSGFITAMVSPVQANAIVGIWSATDPVTAYAGLVEIVEWGNFGCTHYHFLHAVNLTTLPLTRWPTSVTSGNESFKGCSSLNHHAAIALLLHEDIPDATRAQVTDLTEILRETAYAPGSGVRLPWHTPKCNNYQRMIGSTPFDGIIDFVGRNADVSVTSIDVADFGNGCHFWTGEGCEQWAWHLFIGIANIALNAWAFVADISDKVLTKCVNAANAFAFSGDCAPPVNLPVCIIMSGYLKSSDCSSDISGMYIPNATNGGAMLQNLNNNTSDISGWCVASLLSEPNLFDDGATTTGTPVWGTCPGYDNTPNGFSFTDVTGATVSTLYESNTITVAGLDVVANVTVTGGEYSKNGGAYTSAAGTATNGDTFKVRHTSSASDATATDTILTIGTVSDTFTTTTAGAPPAVQRTYAVGIRPVFVSENGRTYAVTGFVKEN